MFKSKGNVLDLVDLVDKFGVDVLRWVLFVDSVLWNVKCFFERIVLEVKFKFVDILVNVYSFYVLYVNLDEYNFKEMYDVKFMKLDEWVLLRLYSIMKKVRIVFDDY